MKLLSPRGPISIQAARLCEGDNTEETGGFSVEPDGEYVYYAREGMTVWVCQGAYVAKFSLADAHGADTDHEALAPMTGKVVAMPVKIGDTVKRGDTVAVLEAMKMEYKLEAEADGVVEEIGAKEGDLVDLGQLLVRLK